MENTKKNSVLIVDDEEINIEVLNVVLEDEYTIYIAKSGGSAVEMALKHKPDLILLDIIMRDLNGFEVLKILKGNDEVKNIPVIIITGLENLGAEEKGLDLGAVDFLHKPFSSKIVKLKVRNQIETVNQLIELKEVRKQLETALTDAENANKAKSSFLARMSHEIRTPLNAVIGISEIQLHNQTIAQDAREAFTRIYSSGDLLLGIINDILDISKIEAGKLELKLREYNMSSMINDTVFLNMVKYEDKGIEFFLKIDENIPSRLIGDEIYIKQILNNLLSNAFKYTAAGEVELSLRAEKCKKDNNSIIIVISVRDTGQGMTAEQLEKIFDEYARFNMEINRTTVGTGLGMSITQNLIRMMDGEIRAESEVGKGSLFTVRIPQGNTNAPAIGKEAAEKLQQFRSNFEGGRSKVQVMREPIPFGRVLIVDDIDMNLYVSRGMLSPYGLQIDTALSGAEAIKKVKSSVESGNKYDIIFMDHMMPVMDGIEATNEIRKLGPEFKKLTIVALTANAVAGMKDKFLSHDFNDFLSKPVNIKELDAILKKWISPNKFSKTDKSKQDEETTTEIDNIFLNALCNIEEINAETGLSFTTDGIGSYRKTLEIFYNRLEAECINLTALLDSNDLKNYLISIHAMKSMLAIIGALDLSKEAYELEIASSKQDIDYCKRNFAVFKNKLLTLHEKLSFCYPG